MTWRVISTWRAADRAIWAGRPKCNCVGKRDIANRQDQVARPQASLLGRPTMRQAGYQAASGVIAHIHADAGVVELAL
jgi:hypothetical protein